MEAKHLIQPGLRQISITSSMRLKIARTSTALASAGMY